LRVVRDCFKHDVASGCRYVVYTFGGGYKHYECTTHGGMFSSSGFQKHKQSLESARALAAAAKSNAKTDTLKFSGSHAKTKYRRTRAVEQHANPALQRARRANGELTRRGESVVYATDEMRIVLEQLEKLGEEKTQEEDDVDRHKAAAEAVRKAVVDMETAAQRYDALRAELSGAPHDRAAASAKARSPTDVDLALSARAGLLERARKVGVSVDSMLSGWRKAAMAESKSSEE
jgi:hypothetical protein